MNGIGIDCMKACGMPGGGGAAAADTACWYVGEPQEPIDC